MRLFSTVDLGESDFLYGWLFLGERGGSFVGLVYYVLEVCRVFFVVFCWLNEIYEGGFRFKEG